MISTRIAHLLAVPVVWVGMLGGAALTFAATAAADDDDTYSAFDDDYDDWGPANEIVASPDTYADPAPNLIPWSQWINEGMASAPQVDTTVQQSR